MNMKRVVNILQTEKECVERQGTLACPNRDCANCDLLLPTEEVLQAYTLAIKCIEGLSENKEEWILDYRECGTEWYHCSKCKLGRAVIDYSLYNSLDEFKKCPICGTDMRGKE